MADLAVGEGHERMHFHVPWIVYTWHHLIQQGMFMTTNSWVQDVVHPPMASGAQRLYRMKRRSGTEFATPYHLTIEHMWPFMLIARDSRDKVKANQGSCLPISPQECQATLHQATEGRRSSLSLILERRGDYIAFGWLRFSTPGTCALSNSRATSCPQLHSMVHMA